MSCDECQEQIFELIEREAIDPEGVREILARCPDCRSAFEETKAALGLAALLPIEEPPAAIDAAILRAAASRRRGGIPLRKRFVQAPPWAVAAIALLAVGVGVLTIPRGVQLESEAVPSETPDAPETMVVAEQTFDEEKVAADQATRARGEPKSGRVARSAAKSRLVDSASAPVKRAAKPAPDDGKTDEIGLAPASRLAAEEAPVLRYLGIQSARYRPALDALLDDLLAQVGAITG